MDIDLIKNGIYGTLVVAKYMHQDLYTIAIVKIIRNCSTVAIALSSI